MKAVTQPEYGSYKVLKIRNIPRPVPEKTELLIKVYTTTINRSDCGIIRGTPYIARLIMGFFKPNKGIAGTDFAGVVEEIGSDVSSFKKGDRVWGFYDQGLESQAEYMVIKENAEVIKIPEGISFDNIVACGEGAHYAYNCINKVRLHRGDKVLVNGSTGAIGSALVQMLVNKGVEVTATANTKNVVLIKSLGAKRVIDFEKEDFTTTETKFDIIVDAAGKSSFTKCKPILKTNGIYISSELGPGNENVYLPLWTKIKGGKRVKFPFPSDCKGTLIMMNELVATNKFKPVIDRFYNLDEAIEGYRYVASGRKTGNVILKISDDAN